MPQMYHSFASRGDYAIRGVEQCRFPSVVQGVAAVTDSSKTRYVVRNTAEREMGVWAALHAS